MVPFAGDGETEQSDRAQALERAGRLLTVSEEDLSPKRLARAVDQALEHAPAELDIRFDGAQGSAQILRQKLSEWRKDV